MLLVKAYVAPNFLRKQTYKQTTKLPAGANATYEISVVSYTFIKKWSELHFYQKVERGTLPKDSRKKTKYFCGKRSSNVAKLAVTNSKRHRA